MSERFQGTEDAPEHPTQGTEDAPEHPTQGTGDSQGPAQSGGPGSKTRRLSAVWGPGIRRRPLLLAVGAVVGFIAIVGSQLHPPDPEARLPGSQRLAALIQRTQQENNAQNAEVQGLQQQISEISSATANQKAGAAADTGKLTNAGLLAGTTAMSGPGFTVTLNDSSLKQSPTGNVNDLVIHSQDVQAVVNGMWASGADAIAVNGERLVSTSAVLCVGNTLLINGHVFSPPYVISQIGADRNRYNNDPLVRQLHNDAQTFSLQYDVGKDETIQLPAYTGPTTPKYAQAAGS